MPYEPSPYFETPSPPETPLWRYMTIDKFMSMLNERVLYFPNVYLFNDKYEGSLSKNSLEEVRKTNLFDENTPIEQDKAFLKQKEHSESPLRKSDKDIRLEELHSFQTLLKDFSNHLMFCNCWFLKETESHSMWAEYGDKSPTSIAIQTTVDDLIKSFGCTQYHIHVGKVKYKNYRTEHIEGYEDFSSMDLKNTDNVLKLFYAPIMHKREIYNDEHEVRAIISFESICEHHLDWTYTSKIPFYSDKLFETDILFFDPDRETNLMRGIPPGIPIRTNIKKLIKAVVVSPYANDYFHKTLRDQMKNNALDPDIVYTSDI